MESPALHSIVLHELVHQGLAHRKRSSFAQMRFSYHLFDFLINFYLQNLNFLFHHIYLLLREYQFLNLVALLPQQHAHGLVYWYFFSSRQFHAFYFQLGIRIILFLLLDAKAESFISFTIRFLKSIIPIIEGRSISLSGMILAPESSQGMKFTHIFIYFIPLFTLPFQCF